MPSKKRLNVHLYVTPICNLRCKHCYFDSWDANGTPDHLLSIQEIGSIITNLSDNYEAAFDVEGGEFFLRKDIAQLFDIVPEYYWHNITITTNGAAKIDVAPEKLLHLDEFRVSVEGHTDVLQQDIRGIPLRPVLNTCAYLRLNGVPVTLRITLHKKNYGQLLEMIDSFYEIGFTRFSFYEYQPVGRGKSYKSQYGLDVTEAEEVLKQLRLIPAEKLGILKLNLSARRKLLVQKYQQGFIDKGYEIVDLSGVPSLTINYNGDLGICPWNIGHDRVDAFRADSFCSTVAQYMDANLLDHKCNCCSAIRILYRTHR